MSSVIISYISIVISLIAVLFTALSFLKDNPKPIAINLSFQFVPKNGLFSYRESRSKEPFFLWNSGIVFSLEIINPAPRPISLFDFTATSTDSNITFLPLTKKTAGNAFKDKLIFGLDNQEFINDELKYLELYEDLNFTIPAYGSKSIQIFFEIRHPKEITSKNLRVEFDWFFAKRKKLSYISKLLFKHKDVFSLSYFQNDSAVVNFTDFDKGIQRELQPMKLLNKKTLRILSSDNLP